AQRDGRDAGGARVDPPDYNTARRLLARHAEFEQWAARAARPRESQGEQS
ncbi:CoA ester lyase, partial [Bordetella pertussis]